MPASRQDKRFSVLEEAHFSLHLALTLSLSCERERHLDAEFLTVLIELESTNYRFNSVCGCSGVAREPE